VKVFEGEDQLDQLANPCILSLDWVVYVINKERAGGYPG